MTLPAALITEKNKLSNAYPWLMLLQIDLGAGTYLRLTSNTADVTFQSNVFTAFPLEISYVSQSLSGEIPDITIGVSNAAPDRAIQGYVEAMDGMVDLDVTMWIIHSNNLGADYADLERHFKIMATICDNEYVYFTLGLISPTQRRFPLYRTMGAHCNWVFKGLECGYSGAATECDHTLKRCQALNGWLRRGKDGNYIYVGATRFGGFPGLDSTGVRFV